MSDDNREREYATSTGEPADAGQPSASEPPPRHRGMAFEIGVLIVVGSVIVLLAVAAVRLVRRDSRPRGSGSAPQRVVDIAVNGSDRRQPDGSGEAAQRQPPARDAESRRGGDEISRVDALVREVVDDLIGDLTVSAPVVTGELSTIAAELAPNREEAADPYRLVVIRTDAVNAMAFPGSVIAFTDGMLRCVRSATEVTAILAHEIGHIENRDHLRSLGVVIGVRVALAALLGGGEGIATVLTERLLASAHSRRRESAADEFAVERLAAVGLDGESLARALASLERAATSRGPAAGESAPLRSFLETHPASSDRMAHIDALALSAPPSPPSLSVNAALVRLGSALDSYPGRCPTDSESGSAGQRSDDTTSTKDSDDGSGTKRN